MFLVGIWLFFVIVSLFFLLCDCIGLLYIVWILFEDDGLGIKVIWFGEIIVFVCVDLELFNMFWCGDWMDFVFFNRCCEGEWMVFELFIICWFGIWIGFI